MSFWNLFKSQETLRKEKAESRENQAAKEKQKRECDSRTRSTWPKTEETIAREKEIFNGLSDTEKSNWIKEEKKALALQHKKMGALYEIWDKKAIDLLKLHSGEYLTYKTIINLLNPRETEEELYYRSYFNYPEFIKKRGISTIEKHGTVFYYYDP